MFRKNDFDTALKFTKNLKYDEQLLAEISRLHGDYLYNKEEFTKAIEHYKLSIKHLEPSYVIKRFLDVQKIEDLISYLIVLNKHSKIKYHCALLVDCYIKQKMFKELELFIFGKPLDSNEKVAQQLKIIKDEFDADLIDLEGAIETCIVEKKINLALSLAKESINDFHYVRLLVKVVKNYGKALDFIQKNVEVLKKFEYLQEYGEIFLENKPN